MLLEGSIPDVTVVDLLLLLSAARKTGVVRFSGSRSGLAQSGAIYFRDGQPVAAEADSLSGEAALEVICSWDVGGFQFQDGGDIPRENLGQPFERLVELAGSAATEWREIRDVVPPPSAMVRMAGELPTGVEEIRLDREEWKLLASMTVPQRLLALGQQGGGGLSAYRRLRKLVEEGLLKTEGRDARV
jgi:hypothetical protein